MLTNYHTHTTFCDGKNTPEEVVQAAIEKGFDVIGFSGHGYTVKESSYCMRDVPGYIAAVRKVQSFNKSPMQIYLGIEEDMMQPAKREDFDYIISSCHYILKDGQCWSVDSGIEKLQDCLALFDGDPLKFARAYYEQFCGYLLDRKPDIIGHFDLITKYDEAGAIELLNNADYLKLAKEYLLSAMRCGGIFEVNTGAMARGLRTSPYPCLDLLHLMNREGVKIVVNSDSHAVETLDFAFAEVKQMLWEIGFRSQVVLYDGKFREIPL